MKRLNNNELKNINGGSSTLLIVSIVTGVIVFAVGILSGYSNPVECNQ